MGMRCVLAPTPSRGDPVATPASLDAVRRLGVRFPEARLREVPVLRAQELDARADPSGATRVWLALEALQVTGSFKVRGALVALDALKNSRRVVAASAGNHGAAVAYAASVLGLQATVCVPRTVARAKRERIERYGAELVIAQSDHYDDAESLGKEISATQGAPFVSAYDDENVVLGNGGSLGFEIVRALGGVPERVLAPFGGGGLSTGLAWAMADESDDPADRGVWGAQSEASCAMAMSLERGSAVERLETGGTTLAEGLEGGISVDAFERARKAVAGIVVVTEEQIAAAMEHAYRDLGLVIEGSAAAALAPVLAGLPERVCGGDLVVVLTGRNVDAERLDMARRASNG
jgi:threonine dehydratase